MQTQDMTKMTRHILQNVDGFLKGKPTYNPVLGRDDLIQEAALCFIKTAREKGIDLAYRNYLELRHVMHDAVRRAYPLSIAHSAYKHREKVEFISIDLCEIPTQRLEDVVEDKLAAENLYASLNEEEKKIVDMRLQGMTIAQMAKEMKVPTYNISYIIKKMRDRLKPLSQPA